MSEATPPTEPMPEPPADANLPLTSFDGLTLKARRIPNSDLEAGRWEIYTEVGGIPWVLSAKKLGGLDDDLQELATPGFKERRAVRYANETGRQRTEPGPGA